LGWVSTFLILTDFIENIINIMIPNWYPMKTYFIINLMILLVFDIINVSIFT